MVPLKFEHWEDSETCVASMLSNDELIDSELDDIAKRQMTIKTDKGIYKIIEPPKLDIGLHSYNGDKYRSYRLKVIKMRNNE